MTQLEDIVRLHRELASYTVDIENGTRPEDLVVNYRKMKEIEDMLLDFADSAGYIRRMEEESINKTRDYYDKVVDLRSSNTELINRAIRANTWLLISASRNKWYYNNLSSLSMADVNDQLKALQLEYGKQWAEQTKAYQEKIRGYDEKIVRYYNVLVNQQKKLRLLKLKRLLAERSADRWYTSYMAVVIIVILINLISYVR